MAMRTRLLLLASTLTVSAARADSIGQVVCICNTDLRRLRCRQRSSRGQAGCRVERSLATCTPHAAAFRSAEARRHALHSADSLRISSVGYR